MLRFYFDYLSPYAYLGWTQIHTLAARHGREVVPVPIVLAALLNAHGHKGPAEIPPKRLWVYKNVVRLAHRLGLPLVPPPAHPFNPLLALRATTAVEGAAQKQLIDVLFTATWGGGPGVADAATVARVLTEAGLDAAAILAWAGSAEAKQRLRADTEAALALGVFGVPSVGVSRADGGEEIFWGYDAFLDVEEHLEGRDPVSAELVARWQGLPVGAERGR